MELFWEELKEKKFVIFIAFGNYVDVIFIFASSLAGEHVFVKFVRNYANSILLFKLYVNDLT